MNDFDSRLRNLLEHEAVGVTADRTRMRRAVVRVRRRRIARAAGAGILACAAVAGGVTGGSASLTMLDEGSGVASQPGEPAFEGGAGTYPVIAYGTFEGRRWTLSVVEDPDRAHPEDPESENPEIAFEIEGGDPNGGSFETYRSWEGMAEPFHSSLAGGHGLVMGMVDEAAVSVTVEVAGGDSIAAAIFDGGDGPVPDTSYYLAFVPGDTSGEVVARDSSGTVVARRPLRSEERPSDLLVECDRSHAAEDATGGPSASETEALPLIGRGTWDGRTWTLHLIEDPDRAHPEDTESDNPEILLDVEGASRPGPTFETYSSPDVVTAFGSGLQPDRGDGFVMGMADEAVASVAFESPEAGSVPASLFDGKGVGRPGTQIYVAFVSGAGGGEIVARDRSGAVIGRIPVGDMEGTAPRGC